MNEIDTTFSILYTELDGCEVEIYDDGEIDINTEDRRLVFTNSTALRALADLADKFCAARRKVAEITATEEM